MTTRTNKKSKIRISYAVELDPFQQEVLDQYAKERGVEETTRARRIGKLLRLAGENEIDYVMEITTCHRCSDIISRGDEGYGTSRGECRKCIEQDDV